MLVSKSPEGVVKLKGLGDQFFQLWLELRSVGMINELCSFKGNLRLDQARSAIWLRRVSLLLESANPTTTPCHNPLEPLLDSEVLVLQ
jgi:hypothetical protein